MNGKELNWNDWYNLLLDYYNEFGNINIQIRYVNEDGYKIGSFLKRQRELYLKEQLSEEQINKLNQLNIIWDSEEYTWNYMYNLAYQYYQNNGHLDIPSRHKDNNGNFLGNWIRIQRKSYQNKFIDEDTLNTKKENGTYYTPLSDDKIVLLESIGMIWNIKENRESLKDLARIYKLDYNSIKHQSYNKLIKEMQSLDINGIDCKNNPCILNPDIKTLTRKK